MPGDENPYLPPVTFDYHSGSAGRSFQIGGDEMNTVFVEASLWTGLKTHSSNAAGKSTPVRCGPCRFELGERERHQVEIQVDRTARVSAFVDGELVERNMFPRLRATIIAIVVLFFVLIFLGASLGFGLLFNP